MSALEASLVTGGNLVPARRLRVIKRIIGRPDD